MDLITEVIRNLLKTRDELGFNLSGEWLGLTAEEVEETLRVAGLVRNTYDSEVLLDKIALLLEELPDVDWCSENIADACYCDVLEVHEAMATTFVGTHRSVLKTLVHSEKQKQALLQQEFDEEGDGGDDKGD